MRQSKLPAPAVSLTMAVGLLIGLQHTVLAEKPSRPNIVWISLEDITPMMGCYGDEYARTPVFDKLADEGCRRCIR